MEPKQNNMNPLLAPEQRERKAEENFREAQDERYLASREAENERLGGGHDLTPEGNLYTKLAGLNLPEVFIAIRSDVLSTINLCINDNEEIKQLGLTEEEKLKLAEALVGRIYEDGGPDQQYHRLKLERGEYGENGDDRSRFRFTRLYETNYSNGKFRNYFMTTLRTEVAALRRATHPALDGGLLENKQMVETTLTASVDALLINNFLTFKDYPGYGSFRDKIYFAIYKNIPGATGSNEMGESNAHISLKDLVVHLSLEDKMKLYAIYQAVAGNVLNDSIGGDMVVDILFPKRNAS
jgi:hypothetical protein